MTEQTMLSTIRSWIEEGGIDPDSVGSITFTLGPESISCAEISAPETGHLRFAPRSESPSP